MKQRFKTCDAFLVFKINHLEPDKGQKASVIWIGPVPVPAQTSSKGGHVSLFLFSKTVGCIWRMQFVFTHVQVLADYIFSSNKR